MRSPLNGVVGLLEQSWSIAAMGILMVYLTGYWTISWTYALVPVAYFAYLIGAAVLRYGADEAAAVRAVYTIHVFDAAGEQVDTHTRTGASEACGCACQEVARRTHESPYAGNWAGVVVVTDEKGKEIGAKRLLELAVEDWRTRRV